MKQESQPPLKLTPYFSARLACYLLATHLLAFVTITLLVRPWWLALGLVIGTLFSLIYSYRAHLLYRGKRTIRSAEMNGQNEWLITQTDGVEIAAELQPSSYIHPLLSLLNFRSEQGRERSLILLPDGIDGDTFRRLRVRLKWKPTGRTNASRVSY
jgi:toxin CptA